MKPSPSPAAWSKVDIDSFVRYYTSAGWLAAIILFTVICGFLGSMIGGKLIQKHFKKAGVL